MGVRMYNRLSSFNDYGTKNPWQFKMLFLKILDWIFSFYIELLTFDIWKILKFETWIMNWILLLIIGEKTFIVNNKKYQVVFLSLFVKQVLNLGNFIELFSTLDLIPFVAKN